MRLYPRSVTVEDRREVLGQDRCEDGSQDRREDGSQDRREEPGRRELLALHDVRRDLE